MDMKEKKLSSKKKKEKESVTKLTIADINKNSNIEVDHTIRKIKEKELRLTLMWTCIFLLIFIVSAFTVGFSVVKLREYSNVESGDLIITFNEKSDNLDNIITLDNNNVLSYEDGLESDAYKFTIENKSNKNNKYKITLEDDLEMMFLDECEEMQFDKKYMYFSINNKIIGLVSDLYNGSEFVIYEDVISGNEKKEFEFRIWVDRSYINNGHYHGLIVVEEV
jgi:hypothetical protein